MDLHRKVSRKRSNVGRPPKNNKGGVVVAAAGTATLPGVDPLHASDDDDNHDMNDHPHSSMRSAPSTTPAGVDDVNDDDDDEEDEQHGEDIGDEDRDPRSGDNKNPDDNSVAAIVARHRQEVMDRLPPSYKARFGNVGYAKYSRVYYPAMIVGPYDASPEARVKWNKSYEDCEKRGGSFENLELIVYWYGANPEQSFGYSLQDTFLTYKEGQTEGAEKNFMKLGSGVNKKAALDEFRADLALPQSDRLQRKIDFVEDLKALKAEAKAYESNNNAAVPKKRKYTRTKQKTGAAAAAAPTTAAPPVKRGPGRPRKVIAEDKPVVESAKKTRKSKKPKAEPDATNDDDVALASLDRDATGTATRRRSHAPPAAKLIDDVEEFGDADMSGSDGADDDDDDDDDFGGTGAGKKRGRKRGKATQKGPKATIKSLKDADSLGGDAGSDADDDDDEYDEKGRRKNVGQKKSKATQKSSRKRIKNESDADFQSDGAKSVADEDDDHDNFDESGPSKKRGRKKRKATQQAPNKRIKSDQDAGSHSGDANSDADDNVCDDNVPSTKRGRKKKVRDKVTTKEINDKDEDYHGGDPVTDADDDDNVVDGEWPTTKRGRKKGEPNLTESEGIDDEGDADSHSVDGESAANDDDYDYDSIMPSTKHGKKKSKGHQGAMKPVKKGQAASVRDVDPIKHETKAYKACLRSYGSILETWEVALQGNDFEGVKECMDRVMDVASDLTAPFIEHEVAPILKKSKHAARQANHTDLLSDAKALSSKMKPLYEEKKQHVPPEFKPPPRKKIPAPSQPAPLKDPPVRAQPTDSPQRQSSEKQLELTNLEGEPDPKSPISRKGSIKQERSNEFPEKSDVAPPPNPPKPDRKSFSLGRLGQMMHREQAPDTAKKPLPRSQSLPSWLVGPCSSVEVPSDDDRRLAVQFFRDMAGQFPSGKVDVESIAISLEAALFAWATQEKRCFATGAGVAAQKADWIDAYWDRVHAVVAGVCGKKDPGTLMHLILQGNYSTPMSVIDQKEEIYQKSFEGSPVL